MIGKMRVALAVISRLSSVPLAALFVAKVLHARFGFPLFDTTLALWLCVNAYEETVYEK